jgi:hypothetical protein
MWVTRACEEVSRWAVEQLLAADDVGCLHHDGVAEHLIPDHDRRQHQRVGVRYQFSARL